MRNISPASLAAIQAQSGVEPAIIIRVFWGGSTYLSYCDRKFETEGLLGKLLSISGIEDVVDINVSSSSVNLTVTLDDSDGAIKSIYNTTDIHKVYVQVLQWFTYLPLSEAFIIFEGEISSPIIWTEGTRTLKFDIVSKLEDKEVGFSPEEGAWAYLPSEQIGKAWPIVFGTVAGSKLLPLNESPTAILASGFAVVNHDLWEQELGKLSDAIAEADRQCRIAYDLGIQAALQASSLIGELVIPDLNLSIFNTGSNSVSSTYDSAAAQYYAQAAQYATDRERLKLEYNAKQEEYELQQEQEFRVVPITQTNLPPGTFTVEMNNWTASVTVIGQAMIIHAITEKIDPNRPLQTNDYSFLIRQQDFTTVDDYNQLNDGQKFTWFDGGTEIKVYGFPRYFIASIGFVNILNVWGRNKYGRAVIPRSWYIVDYSFFGSLPITRVIFPTPLETYPGEWQFGDAEIDVVGQYPTNAAEIMAWAITTFSGLSYDGASFAYVRDKVAGMPMNFVLDTRMNVMQFLKEIAFQARCAIWINDRIFYVRFLPEDLPPVETITDSDVEVGSLILTSDSTEALVTKFVATWKERHNQPEMSKIIFRYNINKYGTHEEEYNFFAYNRNEYVQKAAEFWMIRKSNSWKRLQCRVFLNKLRIEAFDPVQVSFTEAIAANGPVTGLVTRSTFDADTDSLNLDIWLPVRLGEMEQYVYAFPGSTSEIYPKIGDANIVTGNPWSDAQGEIIPFAYLPWQRQINVNRGQPWFTAGSGYEGDEDPQVNNDLIVQLNPSELNPNRPPGIESANNRLSRTVAPVQQVTLVAPTPASYYATVVSRNEGNKYTCSVYMNGMSSLPTVTEVTMGSIPTDQTLPTGYPLIVHRVVYRSNNVIRAEMIGQPPIWVPNAAEAESEE